MRPAFCACGAKLAEAGHAVEILGRFEHECANPHGYTYRVGCYAAAAQVEIDSNPSSEWSWFPGWRWQVERCAGCGELAGWRFTRGDASFHGLILR
jgi:hypothetical protein